ncbi:hypothetical protein HQ403_01070 [Candidatus Kaiserbacteria bacterium]|nr:hypothetical protein [Candidatus Kaiserbacteria bacterium]
MRIFSTLIILLFIISTPVFAAVDSTQVGFVDSSIWFDHEPFFSGQEVRVYTTLANSSNADFKGIVEFYDGGSAIGNANVTLERNGGFQVLWVDWIPQEGDHVVGVQITEATLTPPGGEPESVVYKNKSTALSRFIDTDTDGDGIGNKEDIDDDGDGIVDTEDSEPLVKKNAVATEDSSTKENLEEKSTEALSKIGEFASSTSPKIIAGVKETLNTIEEFRISQNNNVTRKLKEVKQKIDEDQVGFENAPEGEGKKKNGPFNQLQLLALTTAGYTLSHTIAFYIAGILALYVLIRKVIPFLYGMVRNRDDI